MPTGTYLAHLGRWSIMRCPAGSTQAGSRIVQSFLRRRTDRGGLIMGAVGPVPHPARHDSSSPQLGHRPTWCANQAGLTTSSPSPTHWSVGEAAPGHQQLFQPFSPTTRPPKRSPCRRYDLRREGPIKGTAGRASSPDAKGAATAQIAGPRYYGTARQWPARLGPVRGDVPVPEIEWRELRRRRMQSTVSIHKEIMARIPGGMFLMGQQAINARIVQERDNSGPPQ